MNTIEEVFGHLQYMVACIKLAHLGIQRKQGSYAGHIALGDLYDDLADAADEIIESYQGKYGVMVLQQEACMTEQNVIPKLKNYASFLEQSFHLYNEDSWVLNQVDEITKLLYRTIYKLENLI